MGRVRPRRGARPSGAATSVQSDASAARGQQRCPENRFLQLDAQGHAWASAVLEAPPHPPHLVTPWELGPHRLSRERQALARPQAFEVGGRPGPGRPRASPSAGTSLLLWGGPGPGAPRSRVRTHALPTGNRSRRHAPLARSRVGSRPAPQAGPNMLISLEGAFARPQHHGCCPPGSGRPRSAQASASTQGASGGAEGA